MTGDTGKDKKSKEYGYAQNMLMGLGCGKTTGKCK